MYGGFMKKFSMILVLLLFIVAGCSFAQDGVAWRRVDENNFINPDGIVATSEGYTFMLKAFNKGQYEPVNGKKINYTISQYTIDCENMEYKIGVIDSFGYEDNFVNGDYNRYAKFQSIVSGTAVEKVAKHLCKFSFF